MSNQAVIGLGFGDEGKGVTTEYLCAKDPHNTIVIRFSGGHQAGHKVIKGDIEHIFSSFGAGTLSGCPTYWHKLCTVEPVAFWNEYIKLLGKGAKPQIYIHPDCPVTTIYDVYANRTSVELKHGTTGTGFFKTKKRNADGVSFTAHTLFCGSWDEIIEATARVAEYYKIDAELDARMFLDAIADLRNLLGKQVFIEANIPDYEHKVFEGSQGLMLDEHVGYMPHCTPSDVTPRNIGRMGYPLDELFLVTRAYQTRHGNGPMTNEDHPVILRNTEKETNVSNPYQGKFRTSMLDLDQLVHAKLEGVDDIVSKDTKINLVVTCMDQVLEYKLSHGKAIISFTNPEGFVKFIGSCLNINGDLYINESPYSELKAIK